MENFSFEAVNIGLNILVFMVALSTAMVLMGSINEMVEFTREEETAASNGNLIETFGDVSERTFTGAQLYAFYGQKKSGQIDTTLKVNGTNIESYIESVGTTILEKEYTLKYVSLDVYEFVPKT